MEHTALKRSIQSWQQFLRAFGPPNLHKKALLKAYLKGTSPQFNG